ncbi:hypothetical protein Cgig2_010232 [Carnegiea gigantea]|uniref:Uncharacterized protein n=1 Tax=Carnegiea gigantea TaxID=171969 RepID=A0A9Q1JWB9_9CARY|nr:hypothetical protein Cgig2_010232 [Carnegiea gigantea]
MFNKLFLLVHRGGGRFKSFYERVPANLDKIKAVVHSRHAIGELSFSLVMGASGGQLNKVEQKVALDFEEHMGNGVKPIRMLPLSRKVNHLLEVFIPTLESIQVKVEVQVIEGGKERDAQIQNALAVLHMRDEARAQPQPSIYQQNRAGHRLFLIFNDKDIYIYLRVRGFGDLNYRLTLLGHIELNSKCLLKLPKSLGSSHCFLRGRGEEGMRMVVSQVLTDCLGDMVRKGELAVRGYGSRGLGFWVRQSEEG